jgi:hypothetical protein
MGRTYSFSLTHLAAAVLAVGLVTLGAGRGSAEPRTVTAQGAPAYHSIILGAGGRAEAPALDRLASEVRQDVAGERAQIVVMVHGFQTPLAEGQEQFETIANRLRKDSNRLGMHTCIIGVHWDSGSDSMAKWVPKAVGNRLTSLLGFKKAIKNPYLEKLKLARLTGRTGLRSVLFRLQESAPGVPIHVIAHSMGAEVTVAALAPEASAADAASGEGEVEQPERTLRVGLVTLAGADLDYDMFCRERGGVLEQALGRAQVWWVTVPSSKRADGMLEIRRGAGRCDAVGNRGLKLCREDLNRLLRRRGLVLDVGNVPTKHGFVDYLNDKRMDSLTASMLYLQSPESPDARGSVLAALDGVLGADATSLHLASDSNPCLRLYAAWRQGVKPEVPAVTVTNEIGATPAGLERVGMTQ